MANFVSCNERKVNLKGILKTKINYLLEEPGTAVAKWLRCCATNRKVAGSIPAGDIVIFHCNKILPIALWPWG